MIGLLRFIGVVNAGIWFGASIFFMLVAQPAFHAPEMQRLLSLPYAELSLQLLTDRFFMLQHYCGAIALTHLLAEWLYMGKPLERLLLWPLLTLFLFGLAGGFWLQPRAHELHRLMYRSNSAELRQQAARDRVVVENFNQILLWLSAGGTFYYFWRVANAPSPARFNTLGKFRG